MEAIEADVGKLDGVHVFGDDDATEAGLAVDDVRIQTQARI